MTSDQAFVFFREFIFGNNQTGLVTNTSGTVSVNGGENDPHLIGDILPGQSEILYGSGTATSTIVYPSAIIAAWESFFGSVQSTALSPTSTSGAFERASGTITKTGLLVLHGIMLPVLWYLC